MSVIIALDYGERRIGVAVSDEEQHFSFARPAIIAPTPDEQVTHVQQLITAEKASRLLLGLPLSLSGQPSKQTETVKAFGDRLQLATGLEIIYRDERLTTQAAKRSIGDDRTGKLDSLVAQQLLEEYLLQQQS